MLVIHNHGLVLSPRWRRFDVHLFVRMHAPDQTKRSASTSPLRIRPLQPWAADHLTPPDRPAFHPLLWAAGPFGQSWNGYAYVNNNPLSYSDPSGMMELAATGGEVGATICGPVCAGVGAAIGGIADLFALLDIFGGGPPPSIPSSLGTPSRPIMQPSPDFDSQGWNEQVPDDGSGSIDSGTLFGSGNTDPFAFSLENGQITLSNAADVIAGAGDAISLGFSAWFRRKIAGKDPRSCSAYYKAGSWIGVGLTAAYGGVAGAGKEFSHWFRRDLVVRVVS